jgi:hypothetical protein
VGALKRFEPGDLLAFLYTLVLSRQAFWLVPQPAAWLLATGAAVGLGLARVRMRPQPAPFPRAFWLGVALPVVVLWGLHVPRPSLGWDVMNYHLLHGERALRGLLVIPGDFYPYYFPFLNPAPDMVATLFRHLLGYRLGTVGSCLVLLWTGAILFRALSRVIGSTRLRAAAVLWILATEGILWEVGSYMADFWGLPLLLEALFLVLPEEDDRHDPLEDLPLLALFLGTSVAFKLTNLVFVVAIGAVWLWRLAVARPAGRTVTRSLARILLGPALFILPMAPHTLYLWWTTGSPLFPHYNALFRSPLFPPINVIDSRWGPKTLLETLFWPLVATLHPARYLEFAVTSGRLALGFLGALAAFVASGRDRSLRGMAAVVLIGSLLWSRGTGYQRYALFLEVAGGVLLIVLAVRLATAAKAAAEQGTPLRIASVLLLVLLGAQALLAMKLADRGDWSGAPLAYRWPRSALHDLLRSGRDRDLNRDLPAPVREALASCAGWVDAAPKTNGLMALLAPERPVIGIFFETLFDAPPNLSRFDEALRSVEGKRLASFAPAEDVTVARTSLASHGFVVEREIPFELPFFSEVTHFGVVAFVVRAPMPPPGTPLLSARELVLRRPPPPDRRSGEDERLLGSLDNPAEGAEIRGPLLLRGWARRHGEDLSVTFLFDGVERNPATFRRGPRPDVLTVFPNIGDVGTAGYEATFPFTPGDEGNHDVIAFFRSRDGRFRHYPPRRFVWKP